MTDFWRTIRYTLWVLGRSPGFTAVAMLSLTLGIGANTAIFALVNALLLRELPVLQPERLVQLSVVRREDKIPFSYPMFREIERGQRVFSGVIGWSPANISNVETNGVLSQAAVNSVTGNYYSELGTRPLRGRLITQEDARDGKVSPVAVLGYEFWQRLFGGASDVVGKQIRIRGESYTIIGVTRKWFSGMTTGESLDITVPMKSSENRALLWVFITGRLKQGITIEQARAQLKSFWPAVLAATPSTDVPGLRRQTFFSMGLDVAPVATGVARQLRAEFARPLYVLLGIVGLILMVACVNLANLMLARSAAHSHEMGVRVALGASRWAVTRQVLTESLTLSISGSILGFAFADFGSHLLVRMMAGGRLAPITLDLRPDWRVLSLTAAMAILTGVLFGFVPAWRASRADPACVIRANSRTLVGTRGGWARALMLAQVALSLVLLLGAGLLVRTFRNLRTIDLGFDGSVLQISLSPKPGGYRGVDVNEYHRQLTDRLSALPGVLSAGFSDFKGAGQRQWQEEVSASSAISSPDASVISSAIMVSPGFLRTLGIGLVLGRDFERADDASHPPVVIVSSSLAKRLFPEGNAIGQVIRFGFMPEFQELEIIGIAQTVRLLDLRDQNQRVVYIPYLQHPKEATPGSVLLRTNRAPGAITRIVGHEIESFGHEYPLRTQTLEDEASQSLARDRAVAMISGFFGVLALFLALIGLYGLASYSVAHRTREIGIRTALGAGPAAVRWGVLRDELTLVLAGIALGIPCALASSRLIASLLFGVSTDDLPTLLVVSLLLLAVALLAGYLPARRASRIDPMVALRTE
jgi:predicted permease